MVQTSLVVRPIQSHEIAQAATIAHVARRDAVPKEVRPHVFGYYLNVFTRALASPQGAVYGAFHPYTNEMVGVGVVVSLNHFCSIAPTEAGQVRGRLEERGIPHQGVYYLGAITLDDSHRGEALKGKGLSRPLDEERIAFARKQGATGLVSTVISPVREDALKKRGWVFIGMAGSRNQNNVYYKPMEG